MLEHHEPITKPSPAPAPREPLDLKSFVRRLGPLPPRAGLTSGRYRRLAALVETRPVRVSAPPLVPSCWIDGVQRVATIGRRHHRDISLAYVAAGAVLDGQILVLQETLTALCSTEDQHAVQDAGPDVPVVTFPDLYAWTLTLSMGDWVDTTRRALERHVIDRAPEVPGRYVMVDGSLPADTARNDLVGVVKTVDTDWITDVALLPDQGGSRSPAFRLSPQRAGERASLTAFVRLWNCTGAHGYDHSLIRVEVPEENGIDVLDQAAARAVADRQAPGSSDPRWAIQLASMYRAEQVLKARIPFVVDYLA